ncbi:hypothetical protein [Kordia sp.]|uniref:hypothetical protein n=1 Tax=Kordia sp. TaxID=1965332 RepID=UPI003D6BF6EE
MSDIINSNSCTTSEPLMKLESNGTASVLNYNLPQSTAYSAISYVDMGIPESYFKPNLPVDDFWTRTGDLELQDIVQLLLDEIDHASNNSLFGNSNLLYRIGVITRGRKRLLDTLLVDTYAQQQQNPDGTPTTGDTTLNKTAQARILPLTDEIGPDDDFFNDSNGNPVEIIDNPDGGFTGTGGTTTNNPTDTNTGVNSTDNTANTGSVSPTDLIWQFGDINFGDLNYDIPSLFVLRLYHVAGVPLFEIAAKIKRGFMPVLRLTPFGLVRLEFVPEPETLPPSLEIVLHYKMTNYLGNYGAGKTVKTFSLLPGEKTNISIRSWKRSEVTRKQAENILDSFSESSVGELQNIIEQETGSASSSGSGSSKNKNRSFSASLNLSYSPPSTTGGFGGSLGLGFGSSSARARSLNSAISNQVRNLANSTTKQTDKADALREIQVNVETSETLQNEVEETITRELENINKSRVLNFVFRQLLQEYISVTHLDKISLSYYNGQENIVVGLEEMDEFLEGFLVDTRVNEVKGKLLAYLCNIKDYRGNATNFIEEVREELTPSVTIPEGFTPLTSSYIRKRQDLEMEYEAYAFKGIIVDVTRRTIRTDAIIAESLLGYGEALDCYNIKLQNEAVREAILNNDEKVQAMKIIDQLEDPKLKAELYKKVYGDCCDVAQSGCNCNQQINS